MKITNSRIVVEKIEEDKGDGFQVVNVSDSFIYRGNVTHIPEQPVLVGNEPLKVGDTVLFAKHSPDTHELEIEGKKLKFVKQEDILAVI